MRVVSLFTKLRRLGSDQLEDFFTEIVAEVFRRHPDVLLSWLRSLNATEAQHPEEVSVETQTSLKPVLNHDTGSRPDIFISLKERNRFEWIYIESKIGSKQQENQLSNYADHLMSARELANRSLIYVTRDFEPAVVNARPGLAFKPTRWFEFYRHCQRFQSIGCELLTQMMLFMEENNMAIGNQFTPVHILALSNFQVARTLMDATLWGVVLKKLRSICGKTSEQSDADGELRKFNRYGIYSPSHKALKAAVLQVLIGYVMEENVKSGYPEVGVSIYVNPASRERPSAISAMEVFLKKKPGWRADFSSTGKEWGGIHCFKSLGEFICADDHVDGITRHFESLLDDVAEFKNSNPKLFVA
jgi:hypothetical protein